MISTILKLFATNKTVYSCPNCGSDIEFNQPKCKTCSGELEWNDNGKLKRVEPMELMDAGNWNYKNWDKRFYALREREYKKRIALFEQYDPELAAELSKRNVDQLGLIFKKAHYLILMEEQDFIIQKQREKISRILKEDTI